MLLKDIYNKYTDQFWNIGFVDNGIDEIIKGQSLSVRWLRHDCKDRWFADPFILEIKENEVIVLVEEFYYLTNRGRIAKLYINRNSLELLKTEPILEIPMHLSFPAILRRGGESLHLPREPCWRIPEYL